MHILEQWREDHKISILLLSNWLGVTSSAITQIEKKSTRISGDLAIKVSQLTGLNPFDLRPDLKISETDQSLFQELLDALNKVDSLSRRG